MINSEQSGGKKKKRKNTTHTQQRRSTTAILTWKQTLDHVACLRRLNRLWPENIINQLYLPLCVEMQAAALLKRQIYRLQFLHKNVKLDVLNGAHQLLPAIVFRAWCFSTLLSFSPLKLGVWSTWAGKYQSWRRWGGEQGNLYVVLVHSLSLLQQTLRDWLDVETTACSKDAPTWKMRRP